MILTNYSSPKVSANLLVQVFHVYTTHHTQLLLYIGGDPEEVRKSQRARFADEGLVDEIIALADKERTGKYWSVCD